MAATAELARRDPVMARLVTAAGPCRLDGPKPAGQRFAALCRSVVYQQLAGRAAASIYERLCERLGGPPTPAGLLEASVDGLRAAGLSAAKARCLHGLAGQVATGAVVLDDVEALSDEDLVTRLSAVPGIGRWTAEMFLIFTLGRLDVWPVGDYGVRKGYARAWGLAELPSPRELAAVGDTFRPWRSVAAWYCWRAVELPPAAGP